MTKWWKKISDAYSAPERAYHTLEHIDEMLQLAKKYADDLEDRARRPRPSSSRGRRSLSDAHDVGSPPRRVAAPPRPRRGYSAETGRGGDAEWIIRGEGSRDAAEATWISRGDAAAAT